MGNHGGLSKCEMCATPASDCSVVDVSWTQGAINSAHVSQEVFDAAPQTVGLKCDWPSLEEAAHSFVECEISSVGSSWLDIGDEGGCVEEEGDIVVVNRSNQPAPQSWAD